MDRRPLVSTVVRSRLPELLVLAVAASARFWRLGYHSFWFDEVVSLGWAGAGVAYTWEKTFALVEEKHPPGYYLTLHYWQQMLEPFGLAQDDAALRALGSLLGVLTVLGVLVLANCLSGRRTALLAGLFTALSPALVWYSQELRMFQPATTGIVWAVALLALATSRGDEARPAGTRQRDGQLSGLGDAVAGIPRSRRDHRLIASLPRRLLLWLGFIVALLYALYSYLFTAFFLPGLGLSLIVLCWRKGRLRWDRFAEGASALGVATLLWLPLARNAWLVNRSESPPGRLFGDLWLNLWRQVRTFTLWQVTWPDPLLVAGMALFIALLVLGFTLRDERSDRPVRGLLALWIGLPLLIALALQATNDNLFKEDRYYLFLAPFVLWAMARGADLLGRRRAWLGWGSGGLAALLLLAALPSLWTPQMYREQWRAAADYIVAYQQRSPGLSAAGVAHVDYLHRALDWYLRQRTTAEELPTYGLFGGPLTAEMIDDVIAPPLRGIETALGAETLWLVQGPSHVESVDPQRLVESWLDAHYPLITEQHPAGVTLSGYAIQTEFEELPALSSDAVSVDAELAPGLRLAACEVMTPRVRATDDTMHPPSGWVHVRLWWQATADLQEDYQSRIRVVGAEGVWGEKLPRQTEPLRFFPTSQWTPGVYVRDEADVNLNPSTPPGTYTVEVGIAGGETVACGSVTVE